MGEWGGSRGGSGRWSKAELEALARGDSDEDVAKIRGRSIEAIQRRRANPNPVPRPRKPKKPKGGDVSADMPALSTLPATVPAEAKKPGLTKEAMQVAIQRSKAAAHEKGLEHGVSVFQPAAFPPGATPPEGLRMAMDENLAWAAGEAGVAGSVIPNVIGGIAFMGYPFLAELTQRPEYRVISETIADDATRKWIDFEVTGDEDKNKNKDKDKDKDKDADQAALDRRSIGTDEGREPPAPAPTPDPDQQPKRDDPDEREDKLKKAGKTDKVKALRDELTRLGARDHFYNLAVQDGFFGRSHLFMDFGIDLDGAADDELKTPIGDGRDAMSKAKIEKGSLKALQVVEAMWTYPIQYNASNPLKQDWYRPEHWWVMGRQVHRSRMPDFIGHPLSSILKPAYAFGGLSLSQMAKPYIDIWLKTRASVGELVHSFSVMVLMTDMQSMLQPAAGAPDLMTRVALFNAYRNNQGAFVLNKATEDFKNVQASLAGLHELQAQAQEHMASVSRIPLVKLTGISPSGLNASSEGEIRAYYDTIAAYQNRFFRPNLTKLINFVQLSLWGEIDPEITFDFEPLWELSQKEKSEKEKDDADRDQKYVDMGAFSPAEIRKIKIDDPTLPYTDLNPDDVPDLKDEEEEGLEPEGGRPQPVLEEAEGDKPAPGAARDEPALAARRQGLPWADQYEWTRGFDLPAATRTGATIVKAAPAGSTAAQKGLRIGSRVRYERGDDQNGFGRVFGFVPNADGTCGVAVLDVEGDRVLFLTDSTVGTRPVAAEDAALERRRGGDDDATFLPFGESPDASAVDAEFNEADHPRRDDGQFGSGAGGGRSAKPSQKLTPTEKAYLSSYSGDDFLRLNRELREGADGGPGAQKLDAAIAKSTIPAGTTLYRGISKDALKSLIGGDEIKAGQILSDKAFLSTSTDSWIGNQIGGVQLAIEVGEGQSGLDMAGLGSNEHEKEVLLPRNTKLEVVGIRAPKNVGDPIRVRVKTVPVETQSSEAMKAVDELWNEYGDGWAIKQISAGEEVRPGEVDINGNTFTKERVDQIHKAAAILQAAAESEIIKADPQQIHGSSIFWRRKKHSGDA